MNHAQITRAIHTRGAMLLAALTAIAGAAAAFAAAGCPPCEVAIDGFVTDFDGVFTLPAWTGLCAGLTLNACIVAVMMHLNKRYNIFRKMSLLHVSTFLLMQMALPWLLYTASAGQLLCVVVTVCVSVLFGQYFAAGRDNRRVFLVHFLLSGFCAVDCTFALYVPLMVVACARLRIMSMRVLAASLLGILTPWIIILGTGLVAPDHIKVPQWPYSLPDFGDEDVQQLIVCVLFTVVVAMVSWLQNLLKIISYNSQSRAMQSVLSLLTVVTAVAALADFPKVDVLLPLLNVCASLQMAHLFIAVHTRTKSYIAVLTIWAVYLAIYIWSL